MIVNKVPSYIHFPEKESRLFNAWADLAELVYAGGCYCTEVPDPAPLKLITCKLGRTGQQSYARADGVTNQKEYEVWIKEKEKRTQNEYDYNQSIWSGMSNKEHIDLIKGMMKQVRGSGNHIFWDDVTTALQQCGVLSREIDRSLEIVNGTRYDYWKFQLTGHKPVVVGNHYFTTRSDVSGEFLDHITGN